MGMKSTVTLKVDSALMEGVRALSSRRGISVSRLITDHLEDLVRENRDYEQARARALHRLKEGLDLSRTPMSSREELHER